MKIKSERDFWSGLLFVVVGIGVAVAATHDPMGPPCDDDAPCARSLWTRLAHLSARPGPGFLPLALGIVLAVLGAVVLFKALAIESEGGDAIGAVAWRPLAAVVGAVALLGASLQTLGVVAAVPLAAVVASLAATPVRWREVLAVAAVLTVVATAACAAALPSLPLWPAFIR